MLFRREVEHPLMRGTVEHQLPDVEITLLALLTVGFKHLRKAQLKIPRNALTHHADGIDRIDEHPRRTLQNITADVSYHGIRIIMTITNFSIQFLCKTNT